MQTFLPYKNFDESARVLDNKRLNEQLFEARQILAALAGRTKGWVHHPATKMWRGYEWTLFDYSEAVARELARREIQFHKNLNAIYELMPAFYESSENSETLPWWFDSPMTMGYIMVSHRASLFRKDPDHYSLFAQESLIFTHHRNVYTCCERCNYYWPTHIKE
jgi:hypothetical protein